MRLRMTGMNGSSSAVSISFQHQVSTTWFHHRQEREAHGTTGYRRLGCWVVLVAHSGTYRFRLPHAAWTDVSAEQVLVLPPDRWHAVRFPRAGVLSGVHCHLRVPSPAARTCPVPLPAEHGPGLRRRLLNLTRRLARQPEDDASLTDN